MTLHCRKALLNTRNASTSGGSALLKGSLHWHNRPILSCAQPSQPTVHRNYMTVCNVDIPPEQNATAARLHVPKANVHGTKALFIPACRCTEVCPPTWKHVLHGPTSHPARGAPRCAAMRSGSGRTHAVTEGPKSAESSSVSTRGLLCPALLGYPETSHFLRTPWQQGNITPGRRDLLEPTCSQWVTAFRTGGRRKSIPSPPALPASQHCASPV